MNKKIFSFIFRYNIWKLSFLFYEEIYSTFIFEPPFHEYFPTEYVWKESL